MAKSLAKVREEARRLYLTGEMETNAEIAALWRRRYTHICVDEFQDVDEQQYRLLRTLAPPDGNICAIGDPNQAIYGFRGADASCFDRFRADRPDAAIVALKRNYRSSGTIVTASAQVIAGAEDAGDIADAVREMHERITVHVAPTERAEAEFVVHAIERLIGGHSFFSIDSGRGRNARRTDLSFADFAVLYRTEAQSAALCEAFDRSGMPYQRSSHRRLEEEPGMRALLSALAEDGETGELADQLLAAGLRLGTRCDAVVLQRLTALARSCGNDRARFLDAVALATGADFLDPRAERVSLLTLHAAKGLEFAVTFIVGLEDGVLPLHWGEPDETAIAEERRLLYVGMTRAKDRLVLSRALQRKWRGRLRAMDPSPFLRDVEHELLLRQRVDAPRGRPQDRQLELL